MNALPTLMVAPNGARLTKADHPAVPITIDETVACAVACFEAGADGLHLHIRDEEGKHSLDIAQYRAALEALRGAVPQLPVQITTEAVGIFDVATQKQVALSTGAHMVSVSVRELTREKGAQAFYTECAAQGIAVQHILYDENDAALLTQILDDTQLGAPELQLLFVLGRYAVSKNSQPSELLPFMEWMKRQGISPDWATCAFGQNETQCLIQSAKKGGKMRVGFENARQSRDGTIAADNAQRVREMREELAHLTT